jgi:hypothetical protein
MENSLKTDGVVLRGAMCVVTASWKKWKPDVALEGTGEQAACMRCSDRMQLLAVTGGYTAPQGQEPDTHCQAGLQLTEMGNHVASNFAGMVPKYRGL